MMPIGIRGAITNYIIAMPSWLTVGVSRFIAGSLFFDFEDTVVRTFPQCDVLFFNAFITVTVGGGFQSQISA